MKLSLVPAVKIAAAVAACVPAGERDSLGRYACNIAEQTTNSQACELVDGCHVLVDSGNKRSTARAKSYTDEKRASLTNIDWAFRDGSWVRTDDEFRKEYAITEYRILEKSIFQYELDIRVAGISAPRVYEFKTEDGRTLSLTVFEDGDKALHFKYFHSFPRFTEIEQFQEE